MPNSNVFSRHRHKKGQSSSSETSAQSVESVGSNAEMNAEQAASAHANLVNYIAESNRIADELAGSVIAEAVGELQQVQVEEAQQVEAEQVAVEQVAEVAEEAVAENAVAVEQEAPVVSDIEPQVAASEPVAAEAEKQAFVEATEQVEEPTVEDVAPENVSEQIIEQEPQEAVQEEVTQEVVAQDEQEDVVVEAAAVQVEAPADEAATETAVVKETVETIPEEETVQAIPEQFVEATPEPAVEPVKGVEAVDAIEETTVEQTIAEAVQETIIEKATVEESVDAVESAKETIVEETMETVEETVKETVTKTAPQEITTPESETVEESLDEVTADADETNDDTNTADTKDIDAALVSEKAQDIPEMHPEPSEAADENTLVSNQQHDESNDTASEVSVNSFTIRAVSKHAISRNAKDGPPVPVSSVTRNVFKINPILEELVHSIQLFQKNDPSLTVLDISNCNYFTHEHAKLIAEALPFNTNCTQLKLVNIGMLNISATLIAQALETNSSIEKVNWSGNKIGADGFRALAYMLRKNRTLKELRLGHQNAVTSIGVDAEHAFAESLRENTVVQTLGIEFKSALYRDQVYRAITRNKEIVRKQRLALE